MAASKIIINIGQHELQIVIFKKYGVPFFFCWTWHFDKMILYYIKQHC